MEVPKIRRLQRIRYRLAGEIFPCGHVSLYGEPKCRQCIDEKFSREKRRQNFIKMVEIKVSGD